MQQTQGPPNDEAKEKENSAGMEAARASYRKLSEKIESRGESYTKVYRLYGDAAERGNEYIDLHDVVWDKDVEALIASLRENGIEYFTFFFHMVECGGNRLALYRKTAAPLKGWLKSTARARLSATKNMRNPGLSVRRTLTLEKARKRAFSSVSLAFHHRPE